MVINSDSMFIIRSELFLAFCQALVYYIEFESFAIQN